MNQPLSRGIAMEHTGFLGNSRVVLNHYDAATQADIQHVALNYGSEDESMGRFYARNRRGTALYSKQDIREQYCISDRGLGALETDRQSLFGCLSSQHSSPCTQHASFLTVCVRQKIPSDENLYDLYKRHPADYAPYPRRHRYPWGPPPPEIYRYDEDLDSSYFRKQQIHTDPSRYTWMPSDDESVRMERPRSVLEPCPTHQAVPIPPPPVSRPKHVSFARSHTLTSFDDAVVSLSSSSSHGGRITRSQERLLDVRKCPEPVPITRQPEPTADSLLLLEKLKRAPMKTQATQTEACLGRKPLPPSQLNLSPRTIHRVKMVSQGAQTNGIFINGRKLIKSYSEAGGRFGKSPYPPELLLSSDEVVLEHEPLQRTQSDEPPRSPFLTTSPPPPLEPLPLQSDSSSATKSDHESEESESKCQKEIFIDFKPQTAYFQSAASRKPLMKTVSDGEMLLDQQRRVGDKTLTSLSHENIASEEEPARRFTPFFQNSPIRHEGIFRTLEDNIYSSISESFEGSPSFVMQNSFDEEFHENIIYEEDFVGGVIPGDVVVDGSRSYGAAFTPDDECVVPSLCLLQERKHSPFASNDSLANDIRDHSDGIWNESQVTVLQVDSGTDNGTALSSSEMTSVAATSPGSTTLLTPSSRRKNLLLLQHQQRSSMDTEALEEELFEQVPRPCSPRVEKQPKVADSVVKKTKYLTPTSGVRTSSPSWRLRAPEPLSESPLPAVVPDLYLTRADSGKTNTDVSESTTTTDDYITANSGTDSSRKSGSVKGNAEKHYSHATPQECSSFESASSVYSLTRADALLGDDMVVPSFSPPPIPEEASSLASTPVPGASHTGRSTPSDSSSSSGSYSVDGSCPNLLTVPSPKVPSISEDDRSVHYSSSGYYESPLEDDLTWKSPKSDRRYESKKHTKRPYTLDISRQQRSEELSSPSEKLKAGPKVVRKAIADSATPSREASKSVDNKKRGVKASRSPVQNHRKVQHAKRSSPSLLRSPALSEKEGSSWEKATAEESNKATSDESSGGLYREKHAPNQTSPRKLKKNRENNRRKGAPRSPTGARTRRRASTEEKTLSVAGTLPRRRSMQTKELDPDESQLLTCKSNHHAYSPSGSPVKRRRSPKTSPDATKLKALSAESLRSVSPGSDSVFYSDPSSHAAASSSEHQVHCLHCGKEVDIITTDDPDKSGASSNGAQQQQDIVQPPAGFADSPRTKHPPSTRLYKKLEKRFRSEERTHGEKRHHRYRPDVRAKSEERGGKSESSTRAKLRPMARSTDNSMEGLRATDSSPSILPGAPENDDDFGIYDVPYTEGRWIYIDDREEMQTWSKPDLSEDEMSRRDSTSSVESTESEQEFRKRYQAVTHRMVHRKSCLEMYKRQASKSFESDKTVTVRRESGEFGFRIHGSKPVVVSAIEPDTPAETSGLEVGDIVLAVNGVSVLDKSHSEVVKIAHAGSDVLSLEVARTCGVLSPPSAEAYGGASMYSGYLWKLGGYASGSPSNKWIRRWFSVKKDNCLYYYKTDSDKQPVGAMMLLNYKVEHATENHSGAPEKPFRFDLSKEGVPTLHLAADSEQAASRWLEVLQRAVEDSRITDTLIEKTKANLTLPPNAISKPDCFGYLVKLGNQWKSWSRRYCVLKDSCLYFYQDAGSKSAFGVACLHGYRVQQSAVGSKKHAFEIIPSDPAHKHYYFHTESDLDRKRFSETHSESDNDQVVFRWLAALEYSIDRWLKVG